MFIQIVIAVLAAAGLSSAAFYFFLKKFSGSQPKIKAEDTSFVEEAKNKAKEIVLKAEEEVLKVKRNAEEDVTKIRREIVETEKKLEAEKGSLKERESSLGRKLKGLDRDRSGINRKRREIEELRKQQVDKLEQVASLTKSEAEKRIIEETERLLSSEIGKKVKEAEEEAKETADKKVREILIDAMQKAGTDFVAEYTVSRVKLPSEDLKGRIIGRDGRNIKTFETLTGVDLNLDETPDEIMISCFDSVRREIARVALERLVSDGRIQPNRIEDIVKKTTKDIEKIMFEEGEKLCHAVGVYKLPRDLIAHLGKFKYRFSYGQNMIKHTLEETKLGVALAQEVGADVNVVKLGCLLHDIGKVLTDEEGTHVELGEKLLKKHKIPESVVNCVAEHHEDRPFSSAESVLVYIADSISGARPGARIEDYEGFVKRMKALEETANSFDGVDKAYAFAAGREIRVIVQPDEVSDHQATKLASDIARKIESEQTYPGQVKVTVVRETKAIDIAK